MKTLSLLLLTTLLSSCSKPNTLSIGFRCDKNANGKLEIHYKNSNKKPFIKKHSLSINEICKNGDLELSPPKYTADTEIKFVRILEDETKHNLISIYGEHIHRDQEGSWVILKIMNHAPYISNGVL